MKERHRVFLSYSRNDMAAAITLRSQLERCGLSVFHDVESIREGDIWIARLQEAIDDCGAFVVLVGRDGVRRWVGAETQLALSRYFGPHDDAERLPIFPILLDKAEPKTLPAFLRLFQVTPWNGTEPLPETVVQYIRDRTLFARKSVAFEGCPFVGLAAYSIDQAHLFFGRQKETLDALSCFDTRPGAPTIRWLEINGNSGSGKSSLMNAGLLPLIDQGWLWPRTGYERWRLIGPMMPGERPVEMLAECLARAFRKQGEKMEVADIRMRLEADDRGLTDWLRTRKQDDTAFLLAIDQFEELFTFADPGERCCFDRLLATALQDSDCPLFVISTVRADFLDRFEDLPRLVGVRNRSAWSWTLPPIGAEGLREVITGPARLANLDVSAVQEVMVADARDEPGALPLAENALHWLWQKRTDNNRLSGELFTDQGGLAGILIHSADGLLDGLDRMQRNLALNLLFRLIKVDPEGHRHIRRRIPLAEAVQVAGGGDRGRALVSRLAGERARDGGKAQGPLRLITIAEGTAGNNRASRWVNLIHETLIRSKGPDAEGRPQPYWPTLWAYIEQNKDRAMRSERLQLLAQEWEDRKGFARLFGLAGWSDLLEFRGLAAYRSLEQRYLRWSWGRAFIEAVVLMTLVGLIGENVYWATKHQLPYEAVIARWEYIMGVWKPPLPKLAKIPDGQFMMGDKGPTPHNDEQPVHLVTISEPFYLSSTEITFAQYDAFLEAIGRLRDPPRAEWGRNNQPVINITWFEARAYAEWFGAMIGASCRLPSESQWEYACRAGSMTKYAFGDKLDITQANFGGPGAILKTSQVCAYPANNWSLCDMHGNVSEWVEDCYKESYQNAPNNGQARSSESIGDSCPRALRGGSWVSNVDDVCCAARQWAEPNQKTIKIGFRALCSSSHIGGDSGSGDRGMGADAPQVSRQR